MSGGKSDIPIEQMIEQLEREKNNDKPRGFMGCDTQTFEIFITGSQRSAYDKAYKE